MAPTIAARAFTVGHSRRSLAELVALLHEAGVTDLIDVRRVPRSRFNPHFNGDALIAKLPAGGIRYRAMPDLGGLREAASASTANAGWRNPGFRAFADYAATASFARAFAELRACVLAAPSAIMCAERDWRRCHRQIIADRLIVEGFAITHLVDVGVAEAGALTPFARLEPGGRVVYPAPLPRQTRLDL
jgi:uncharacterized protein (DUF488 family)